MGPLIVIYVLMILGSVFFSASENALDSVNKVRLRTLAEGGNRRGRIAFSLVQRDEWVLPTLLIGTKITRVCGASVATLLVFELFEKDIEAHVPVTAIAAVATALLVFFLADTVSKSLAVAHPEGFCLTAGPLIWLFVILLYPAALLFRGISLAVRFLFRIGDIPTVTEEELSDMIETVEEEGGIDADTGDLLQSALEFADTTVSDVLTLWEDVETIRTDVDLTYVKETVRTSRYSRLPLLDSDSGEVVGILQVRAYLRACLRGDKIVLKDLTTPVFYTTLDAPIDHLLEDMSQAKASMAVVRAEDGGLMGIVTVEDCLEELVGEIYDETDLVNPRFMKLGGNYFRVSGKCTVGEMLKEMAYRGRVDVSRVKTVAAWVREQLGHAPREEDTFIWRDLTVTVTEAEEGKLLYAEVKLAHPVLDAVTEPASHEEEVGV